MSGNRIVEDKRNSLYKDMLEIIDELQPEFIVAENVKGLRSMLKGKVEDKIKKVTKSNKKVTKKELDELIDFDGTFSNSRIPILDPHLHPKKTTDQTVAATRITQDPFIRGFRFYYGESELSEIDMSGAFGYEETKDIPADETIEFLEKEFGMDPETAKNRTKEMGKTEERDEKSEYKDDKNFVGRPILQEKEIDEDTIIKRQKDLDIYNNIEPSQILIRNAKSLKKLANKEGISIRQLFKIISGE
jgi:site-specific DNA-cytosine methylase